MQNAASASSLAQLDSLASTTVAAPAPIRTQGWTTGARPMANHADMLSTCSCHFGGFFGFFGRRIRCHCRIAAAIRTTPIAIRTTSAVAAGDVCGLGGLLPVASTVATSSPSWPLRLPRPLPPLQCRLVAHRRPRTPPLSAPQDPPGYQHEQDRQADAPSVNVTAETETRPTASSRDDLDTAISIGNQIRSFGISMSRSGAWSRRLCLPAACPSRHRQGRAPGCPDAA